ncbi:MAG TPA: glycine--tRNA ligase subunit beta [Anaerolineae bacterium]|nr:glycine--tRNA ligase subunit beta [Anaerolineae bacterium]
MSEKQPPTMQSLILNLQQYWADQGCILWQPYHTEVGAGTFNPATFLRVLGPEPWWVAYVEPSIRPTDGRYGENPNRWQHYYQFQVILKPDPGDPQERFLRSLVALGIDPAKHDFRFVEDNWVAPTLGAWGLGWEVWLDGQEITQFTYFQQAGGQALNPVSVEITYGLERILLALQNVDSFVNIRWNEHLSYGDIYLRAEQEHSQYNFEIADVERLRTMYDEFEAEAESCLKANLVLPAHDYVLKCSHTFNLLDARGAVGVTERATLFGRMRDLAQRVAEAYLAHREELGYPWRGRWQVPKPELKRKDDDVLPPDRPAPFLLEIGTEELPVDELNGALEQLSRSVAEMLNESHLEHGQIQIMGTPRRIVVYVEDLAPSQAEQILIVKGPPADRAFDEGGSPTAAAEGFARSQGVSVLDLEVREQDGGRYVFAEIRQPGSSAHEVLREKLLNLIADLRFENPMRWNQTGVAFSRPIRWLVSLHEKYVVPFEYAGLYADRRTYLLRFVEPESVKIGSPGEYLSTLEEQGILLDFEVRKATIEGQITQLAEEIDGELVDDATLLSEVTNLVEKPTAFRGSFDKAYLKLPRQVLISVMKKHQRCFPVERKGMLLPYFITVRNGGREHLEVVTRGNEHVIEARFADAAYFIERDIQQPLNAYLPRLATMVFQTELGSMLDKVNRIERLTAILAQDMSLNSEEEQIALRAAHLSKADLATQMVVEMTSLQGEMGREYARRQGEPSEVAEAIFEHHLPRFAGDRLPQSRPGWIVGLADRLDTLMGLFAAGLQPTGARDPYAMRRTAIGLVQILINHGIRFDLRVALRQAFEGLPIEPQKKEQEACLDFIITRQQTYMLNEGYPYDVVEAVLAEQGHDPAGAAQAVREFELWRKRKNWLQILQAYARCARITRDIETIYELNPQGFVEQETRALYAALEQAEDRSLTPGSVDDFLGAFEPMIPTIDTFFDEVLVMTEDNKLRTNRLALLQRIVALADGVADMSKLEGF